MLLTSTQGHRFLGDQVQTEKVLSARRVAARGENSSEIETEPVTKIRYRSLVADEIDAISLRWTAKIFLQDFWKRRRLGERWEYSNRFLWGGPWTRLTSRVPKSAGGVALDDRQWPAPIRHGLVLSPTKMHTIWSEHREGSSACSLSKYVLISVLKLPFPRLKRVRQQFHQRVFVRLRIEAAVEDGVRT